MLHLHGFTSFACALLICIKFASIVSKQKTKLTKASMIDEVIQPPTLQTMSGTTSWDVGQ